MAQPQPQACEGGRQEVSENRAKSMQVCVKAATAPTDAQLAAIRQYTLRDFAADELMVRTFVLAHNAIDRDNECFDEPLLGDFARTIVGKGCYVCHPGGWNGDGGPAEGRVFGAELQRMSFDAARQMLREPNLQFPPDRTEAVLLTTDTFFVRTPDNQSLLAKLDGGVAGDISIGFHAAGPQQLNDADGRALTAERWTSPGEALEQSLVWLGAQQGARAVKTTIRKTEQPEQETAMTPEQIKAMQDENASLKGAQQANAKAVQQIEAVRKALGDDAALIDAPEKLASAIADGRKFHKALVDDIVTLERHLKITGDTEEDVKAARELYDVMPIGKLETVRTALEARQSPAGRLKGGDPNGTAPGAFQTSPNGKTVETPLENPALAA